MSVGQMIALHEPDLPALCLMWHISGSGNVRDALPTNNSPHPCFSTFLFQLNPSCPSRLRIGFLLIDTSVFNRNSHSLVTMYEEMYSEREVCERMQNQLELKRNNHTDQTKISDGL
ncbi:hypothetical protein Zmor_002188 [Zophobas morio]|uniref:Uncharacterized protein n=1 Tax=Zophobas morio TaxID=2755281 RepID=A0AA38MTE5_9CUCU|nr:hypothetical protein Zmor_002188 [Zophobas morio]